jgi:TonB family protein
MSEKLLTHLFDAKPPRDKRDEVTATVVSVIGHVLLIVLLFGVAGRKLLAVANGDMGVGDGIGAGPAGGGGGGGSEVAIVIAPEEKAPPAPVEEKPPEPIPQPIPIPEPVIKPMELPPPLALALPDSMPRLTITPIASGAGSGQGSGTGAGTGPGTGPGSGGGSGGGEGGGIGSGFGPGTGRGRLLAPSPEVMLIPPPAPGSVRGKTVVVRLAVDSTGAVKDVEIIPSTGDRKYDSALKKMALGWRFRAARDPANKPVSVLFDVTFTF